MARRPDPEKPEIFTQKDLDELRYNLAHLSVVQTLVQVWRQLWKWR